MARELRLPELAESVVEGEIIRWLVAEGDSVALDQPVAEVLTDKATVELPSPFAGRLVKHLAAEGDIVQVNAVIALIEEAAAVAGTAAGGAPGGTGFRGARPRGEAGEAGPQRPPPPRGRGKRCRRSGDRVNGRRPVPLPHSLPEPSRGRPRPTRPRPARPPPRRRPSPRRTGNRRVGRSAGCWPFRRRGGSRGS